MWIHHVSKNYLESQLLVSCVPNFTAADMIPTTVVMFEMQHIHKELPTLRHGSDWLLNMTPLDVKAFDDLEPKRLEVDINAKLTTGY